MAKSSTHLPNGADTRLSRFLGSGRITGKEETAPAEFEDDLAPTANHSGGKDLRKLRGCVAFCWPDWKLNLDCCHPNYEGI